VSKETRINIYHSNDMIINNWPIQYKQDPSIRGSRSRAYNTTSTVTSPGEGRKKGGQMSAFSYFVNRLDYLATFSSHLTIPNITAIDITHTIANTNQQYCIGQALYIKGPIHRKMLPTAVAPSHKPWQRPTM